MITNSTMLGKVRGWLYDEALPLWIAHGIDPRSAGPVEVFPIGGDLTPLPVVMRTRVAGRQLYAFSEGHLMGLPGALAAATRVFEFMLDKVWMGSEKGWCKTLTPQGQPLDVSRDLYDFAFCVFGLAWYYEASGDDRALQYARETLLIVDRDFRHPSGLGFHHCIPGPLPRQQNPHMHLMEAVLKLQTVASDELPQKLASELANLFAGHFYNSQMDCLPEFFSETLEPCYEASGAIKFEPGHQFEWAWILAQHQKLSGDDQSVLVRRLVTSAERYGVCKRTGLTFNAVDSSGNVLDAGSRTWPNTERIKGWLGLYESTGAAPWQAVDSSCAALFAHHLGQAPIPGLWSDAFSEDGAALATTVPASTLYHLQLAFSEVIRLARAQENSTRS